MRHAIDVRLLACGADLHIEAISELLYARGEQPSAIISSAAMLWRGVRANTPGDGVRKRGLIRGLPQAPRDLDEIEAQAWTELVESVAHDRRVKWLSSLSALRFADNKINQLCLAAEVGVPVPKTLVGATTAEVTSHIGRKVVVKPLGAGVVTSGPKTRVFYSTKMDVAELNDQQLARAPVLLQEPIVADMHLRIVTVQGRAWSAGLDAKGLPLDWREATPNSRRAWRDVGVPSVVRDEAIALAKAAKLGFSSQDWIVEGERCFFLDLNPNGGWLFLPSEMREEIGQAIVDFLVGED